MRDVDELRTYVMRLARGFLAAFAIMAVWLAYWHVFQAPALRADPHNPRARERLKATQPGRIVTSDGHPILMGVRGENEWYLEYPGHETYCHLTGYNLKTGLQPALRNALYGVGEYEDPWCQALRGRPTGCEIALTIDSRAQALATDLMVGKRGAVVAIDPRTGGLLVMVSAPAYEPTGVLASTADFNAFQNHPDKPELNRALLGQYAPGSVLKILTAAAAIDAGIAKPSDEFRCKGRTTIGGSPIVCRRAEGHGELTLREGFIDSCNVVFGKLGGALGPQGFLDYVNRFALLQRPALPLPSKGGRMAKMTGEKAEGEAAEAAIGQGATLLSPIAIARLAATIAAGGAVPRLKLVKRITGPRDKLYHELKPEAERTAVSSTTAGVVAGMMVEVVEQGTGRRARIRGVRVAGKTGSAENPSGPAHAWFAGFAPADNPQVAIAVIVENGGSGGSVAAPIARRVMKALVER